MNPHPKNGKDILQLLVALDILKPGEMQVWQLQVIAYKLFKHVGISEDEIRDHLRTLFS